MSQHVSVTDLLWAEPRRCQKPRNASESFSVVQTRLTHAELHTECNQGSLSPDIQTLDQSSVGDLCCVLLVTPDPVDCLIHTNYIMKGKQGQCSGSYLEHDGEEHHHNRRGDKVILGFDMLSVQQHHQSERHRPSQATVRHHHLVDLVQWNETETVQNPGLTNHT